jgi:hypothetical protein
MTASTNLFARRLLRWVVGAAVPIDGAHWVDTRDTCGRRSAAIADATAKQSKAEVEAERVPVRLANWR